MSDALEDGYKLLSKDLEMDRPNRKSLKSHCGWHCTFYFTENQQTSTCNGCGSVMTNPDFTIKGEQK